jgi:adenylate cyclase
MKVALSNFFRRSKKMWLPRVLGLSVVFAATYLGAAQPGFISQLGSLLFDRYQVWQPREYHDDIPVRVVDIDNESIERIGQWPWSRLTMAKLNNRLSQAGAGVVAYDIIFSEADRTSPSNLVSLLSENPSGTFDPSSLDGLVDHDDLFKRSILMTNTVLGFFLLSSESTSLPATAHSFAFGGSDPTNFLIGYYGTLPSLSGFSSSASGEGFVSFSPEGDGIVRTAPLFQRIDNRIFPSLSVEALRAVQGAQTYILRSSDGTEEMGSSGGGIASAKIGQFTVSTDARGRFPVYFAPATEEIRTKRLVPAWQILDESVPIETWSDKIAGNIIFIGTSAEGLKDLVATPVSPSYEGVGVHAEVVEQIIGEELHGKQILQRPYWAKTVELFAVLIPGLLLVIFLPRLGAGWGAAASIIVIISIAAYSWLKFSNDLLLINPVYPILAIALTYLLMTIVSFWLAEAERSQIRGAFSRYLSPTMVSKVSEDPGLLKLGGEERPMTILFLDIRSFSKISESMEPQEIVGFLNLFLTPMTDTLQNHSATIDKYIGDAIVAFWNAPLDDDDHERNACRAVLAMSQTLKDLRDQYDNQNEVKWPEDLAMGIGLNTGTCCVGNLGSEQRFSYSMIGDAANLASRVEGLTKQYKTESLVGNSTATAASDFALLEADLIRVVGRQTPERIWILVGDEDMAGTDDFQTLKSEHDKFQENYRAQDWDAANAQIERLQTLAAPYNQAGYYDIMSARIATYVAEPPAADWDGVFVATSK